MQPADLVPTWQRPRFVRTDGVVEYGLYCYSDRELEIDLVVDGADGYPDRGAREFVGCQPVDAAEYEALSGHTFFEGPIRSDVVAQVGERQLERLRFMYMIMAELSDPSDLSYLQTAWAMARQIVRAGACLVREGGTGRLFLPADIMSLDPRRAFASPMELVLVRETDARPEGGYVLNTLGMHKFARPDLIVVTDGSEQQVESANEVIHALCDAMALGAVIEKGPVRLATGFRAHVEPYRPGVNGPADDPLFASGLIVRML